MRVHVFEVHVNAAPMHHVRKQMAASHGCECCCAVLMGVLESAGRN